MISLFALLLAQAAAVPPPNDEEIVVMAQVTRIAVTLGRDQRGQIFCHISQSSGDPALDEFTCRDLARCVKPGKPEMAKTEACVSKRKSGLAKRWLKRKSAR